ncbi:MAG: protein-L-isoaspartate(D-aspartate) O-methyltransferase [Polaromonas sp.]|nr:protein-L-isoaspartate(D-aspartate) O-methyltransferase [Polaromonas sp.]MBP8872977.1 protein-L-isoaspartate(D-aspartate) O-methyltransferase [Polaromonas sp.]MBP9830655.1 protein-L-isoaspartate(D-aspartate) O-methyltransferase [Polaromonas sp.]
MRKPTFPATLDLSLGRGAANGLGVPNTVARVLAKKPVTPVVANLALKTLPSKTIPVHTSGLGLDSSKVRATMVRKLEAQGIQDVRVLTALNTVPRHQYVDTALANQAYEDTSLPIGWGQTISKPNVVARMMSLLFEGETAPYGRVLEIGTGCGYQAALLSQIASEVYSIERIRGLYEKAQANVRPFAISNLRLLLGDGMLGYPKGAPYFGIIAAAGGEAIPQSWIDQLAVGGRIVAPVENNRIQNNQQSNTISIKGTNEQSLVVIDKTATGIKRTVLELVQFVPLKSGIG